MSVFGALYAAVSGLNANSNALGIISDNISNANTVGYKETSTDFSTLVTQSGAPSLYSPGGVNSSPFYNVSQQGILQAESTPTDLAISGGGFFVVNSSASSGGQTSYTRAGDFTVDANGNLVNAAGLYLQGQPLTFAQAETIAGGNFDQLSATTLSSLQTINVSSNAGAAQPTSNISLVANLPANDTSTPETVTVPVYDSLGVAHQMTLTLSPVPVAAVPSTIDLTQGGTGSLAAGDTFTASIDGVAFPATAALGAAPTLADVSTALNNTFTTQGVAYTASVVGGKLQITDPAGKPITASITCSDPTVTLTAGAPTNGSVATTVPNEWQVTGALSGAGTSTVTIAPGDNIVKFNTDGTLDATGTTFNTANALSIAWDPSVSSGTSPQTISFNVGSDGASNGLSQIGTSFTVGQINQDGVAFGSFSGVTVDSHGVVTANYDNGLSRAIYMIPVATFSNPDGLDPISGNAYLQTNESGSVLLRESGQGAAGTIAPSSLENSTVDIATEFSNLIVTQRAYEANSKIITTADQMLETLIQAKQ
jgi:flagellar hook protein FlgE